MHRKYITKLVATRCFKIQRNFRAHLAVVRESHSTKQLHWRHFGRNLLALKQQTDTRTNIVCDAQSQSLTQPDMVELEKTKCSWHLPLCCCVLWKGGCCFLIGCYLSDPAASSLSDDLPNRRCVAGLLYAKGIYDCVARFPSDESIRLSMAARLIAVFRSQVTAASKSSRLHDEQRSRRPTVAD